MYVAFYHKRTGEKQSDTGEKRERDRDARLRAQRCQTPTLRARRSSSPHPWQASLRCASPGHQTPRSSSNLQPWLFSSCCMSPGCHSCPWRVRPLLQRSRQCHCWIASLRRRLSCGPAHSGAAKSLLLMPPTMQLSWTSFWTPQQRRRWRRMLRSTETSAPLFAAGHPLRIFAKGISSRWLRGSEAWLLKSGGLALYLYPRQAGGDTPSLAHLLRIAQGGGGLCYRPPSTLVLPLLLIAA